MNSKVSFVIPTFNRVERLKERVREVRRQTYQNYEIVVVDDCSTDGTWEYLQSEGDIVKVRLHENSGSVSIPRMIGVDRASGEFVAPTDDDVEILPRKLDALLPLFDAQIVMAYGGRLEKRSDGLLRSTALVRDWNPLQPNGWGVDNGQMIYRRNVFDKIPVMFPKRGCDWELAKQIKSIGDFAYTEENVCVYVWHGGNRSLDNETATRAIFPQRYLEYFHDLPIIKYE